MTVLETVAQAVAKEVVDVTCDFISKNTRKSASEDHALGLDVSHVAVLGGEYD